MASSPYSNREEMPQEWLRSVIILVFKRKEKTICDNYRGISLLCNEVKLFEKLFTSLLLQHIRKRTEEILSESQAVFRRGRSTIDQLFT